MPWTLLTAALVVSGAFPAESNAGADVQTKIGAGFHPHGSSVRISLSAAISEVQKATLTAGDGTAGEAFGDSVAISADGSTAIVGTPAHQVGSSVSQGVAYIFSGPNWENVTELTDPNGQAGASFGSGVALSADGAIAAIGAPGENVFPNQDQGAVYVFSGPNWSVETELHSADGETHDEFPSSLAISADGSTIVAGAWEETVGSNTYQGAAYVFGGTNWATETELLAPNGQTDDYFGQGVALSADGSVIVIGAPGRAIGSNPYQGAAFVYQGPSWSFEAQLVASNGEARDNFGEALAVSSDGATVLVGSPAYDVNGTEQGAAFVFAGPNRTRQTQLLASNGAYGDGFGASVALSADGSTALIGADGAGAAYEFTNGWSAESKLTAVDGSPNDFFGVSVSLTADASDALIGSPGTSVNGHAGQGAAYVFGTAPPPPPPPVTRASTSHGYWLVGSDGGIFSFGSAQFYGSMGGITLQRPVVGVVPTRDRDGYWLDASDGGVFSFGDTQFFGSIPGLGLNPAGSGEPNSLNAPIVGMVPSHDEGGYFMVASDGGVFAFGEAHFAGSCPGIGGCSGAAVAVMPDASGNGYWLVTATGSVYTFGDAAYLGAPGLQSSAITSAVATPDGGGYYVLDAAGQVFAYGDANGSLGNVPAGATGGLNPASAIFVTSDNAGYWVSDALGDVYTFGDAPNDGSMAGTHLDGSIIAASGS